MRRLLKPLLGKKTRTQSGPRNRIRSKYFNARPQTQHFRKVVALLDILQKSDCPIWILEDSFSRLLEHRKNLTLLLGALALRRELSTSKVIELLWSSFDDNTFDHSLGTIAWKAKGGSKRALKELKTVYASRGILIPQISRKWLRIVLRALSKSPSYRRMASTRKANRSSDRT